MQSPQKQKKSLIVPSQQQLILDTNQEQYAQQAINEEVFEEDKSPDRQYSPAKKKQIKNKIKNPIEISWQKLIISVEQGGCWKRARQIHPNHKIILNNLFGSIKPGNFTAILGPSGCGKTTLLNFLSGRLLSENLEISGSIFLNTQQITDIQLYSSQMAYVMQDDILLATFSPREAFMFSANLRLKNKTFEQRIVRVEKLIEELGLEKCAATRVGNSLIRGVSGGERKRTSIGVELLTDPSVLFLDEPTTGLDSATALQVISVLQNLAARGVNVISTIHQPSSEIFQQFDKLILMVQGNIIYQGLAQEAVNYFGSIGFQCPEFSNPSDYMMKLMNEEGLLVEKIQQGQTIDIEPQELKRQFKERLDLFIKKYKESDMNEQAVPSFNQDLISNDMSTNVNMWTQFILILQRAFVNQIRNPIDFLLKIGQSVALSLMCIMVFNEFGDGLAGIQSRIGACFFLVVIVAFTAYQGTLVTFSLERPLFLRERLSNSYEVGPYYWGRSLAELPFQILYPCVAVITCYHLVGYNEVYYWKIIVCCLIQVCLYWYCTAYGVLTSIIVPKVEVAMALVPINMIPLLVLGGFFVNINTVPSFLSWIQYLSMFKYGFEATAINEFNDLPAFTCAPVLMPNGQQVTPDCDPFHQLGFSDTLGEAILILLALGLICRILGFIGMHLISNPKRPKLNAIHTKQ